MPVRIADYPSAARQSRCPDCLDIEWDFPIAVFSYLSNYFEKIVTGETILLTDENSMMRQYAWPEFNEGRWHLLTDVCEKSCLENRNWPDTDAALTELEAEGLIISGYYPNELSERLGLGNTYQGYGLMRTIH